MWRLLAPGLCTWLAIALPAFAAESDTMLVLPLEGPSSKKLDAAVGAALPAGLTRVAPAQALRADQLLRERSPNTAEDEAYSIVAHRLEARAVLEGAVTHGDTWHLRLAVRRGDDGTVIGQQIWAAGTIADLVATFDRELPAWINRMLAQMGTRGPDLPTVPPPVTLAPASARRTAPRGRQTAAAPPASHTDPFEQAQRKGSAEDPFEQAQRKGPDEDPFEQGQVERPQPIWEVSLGPRVLARTFKYSQNRANLPGYSLVGAGAIAADGTIYPLGSMTATPWMRDLGVSGAVVSTLAAKTVTRAGGAAHDTALRAFRLGPRYRLARDPFFFTGGLDFGQDWAEIDAPDETPPNVRYTFLRPSVGARFEAGRRVSLRLDAAYLHVLSLGQLGSAERFPHDTVRGAEVAAGLAYAVDDTFEVRLCADFRHFAHAMNFQTGDPYAVGGALDEHFGVALLVAYRGR
jgi:hypothetical protein